MARRFRARSTTPGERRLTDAAITVLVATEADYPSRDNVLTTDTVAGFAGLYHAPLVSQVLAGLAFGPSDSLKGELPQTGTSILILGVPT